MTEAWLTSIDQAFQWIETHPIPAVVAWAGVMGTTAYLKYRHHHPRPSDVGYGSASWATDAEIRRKGLLTGEGIVVGLLNGHTDQILRVSNTHVLAIGPSGIGKSTLLICTLRSWAGDALVLDLTGDLIEHTALYRPGDVYVWEPASPQSPRLDFFGMIRWGTPYETVDVQRWAAHITAIDVDSKSDIGTYYKDIAELVLTFTPIYLHYTTPERASPYGLMTFLRHPPIAPRPKATVIDRMLQKMAALHHPTVQLGTHALLKESSSRQIDGWNAAARWLNPWLDPVLAQATGTAEENPRVARIPFERFQQGETPLTLIIRLSPDDALGRLRNPVRFALEQIFMWTRENRRSPGDYQRPLLAVFDDMGVLGHIKLFERMVEFDRKYGIRFFGLLQDFNQVWEHFGQYTSLLTNCRTWVVFQPNDPRNADFLTGKLGAMTWRESNTRVTSRPLSFLKSRSHGETTHPRQLMTAEELQKLEEGYSLVFTEGLKLRVHAPRYYEHPLFRGVA